MPLNINFQQILLHMFNFVILAFGLYMLLYKPVVAFMKKREDHFADLEKQAQTSCSRAPAVPPNRSAMPCSKARRRTLPRWLCPLRAS